MLILLSSQIQFGRPSRWHRWLKRRLYATSKRVPCRSVPSFVLPKGDTEIRSGRTNNSSTALVIIRLFIKPWTCLNFSRSPIRFRFFFCHFLHHHYLFYAMFQSFYKRAEKKTNKKEQGTLWIIKFQSRSYQLNAPSLPEQLQPESFLLV